MILYEYGTSPPSVLLFLSYKVVTSIKATSEGDG